MSADLSIRFTGIRFENPFHPPIDSETPELEVEVDGHVSTGEKGFAGIGGAAK